MTLHCYGNLFFPSLVFLLVSSGMVCRANSGEGWEGPYNLTIVPTAVANLPDGRLLLWSAYLKDMFNKPSIRGKHQTWISIFDPESRTFTEELIKRINHDMFCPGTAILPDGVVMITGGGNNRQTSFYDPRQDRWSRGPKMRISRGYHSMTMLADGSIFTLGGSWTKYSDPVGNKTGEVYDGNSGRWSVRDGIPCDGDLLTNDREGVYRADNHMWLFSAPNGKIFHAGPAKQMHWIDIEGNGTIYPSLLRGDDFDAMNGNAVMYDVGKILTVGGAGNYTKTNSTSNAYMIDINDESAVVVKNLQGMRNPRAMCNSVVLPSGEVVVVGGMTYARTFLDEYAIYEAEIWSPETETFTSLGAMSIPRNYHSWAILIKDGRIVVGGGGLCGDCNGHQSNHFDLEIFTPPYLLDETGSLREERPVIESAPDEIRVSRSFRVTMRDDDEYNFVLMRLAGVTHSVTNELRRIPLSGSRVDSVDSATFFLDVPSNPSVVLPGTYFLFALNQQGIPSVAATVSVPISKKKVRSRLRPFSK